MSGKKWKAGHIDILQKPNVSQFLTLTMKVLLFILFAFFGLIIYSALTGLFFTRYMQNGKFKFLKKYQSNYKILCDLLSRFGKEIEDMGFTDLEELTKTFSIQREMNGVQISFYFEPEHESKDELFLLIGILDCKAYPTLGGGTPTYTFVKRRDGTVVYPPDGRVMN